MRSHLIEVAAVVGLAVLTPTGAWAEPTDIVVRVLSKDAKFIGTSMGGMQVTLRDAHTGEILATGLTRGGTGDTKRLMHESAGAVTLPIRRPPSSRRRSTSSSRA